MDHSTVGFWFLVFIIVAVMATWGSPDLIDAWIYYLSDGFYKGTTSVLQPTGNTSVFLGSAGKATIVIGWLLFTICV